MLDAALSYARLGLRVLPLWTALPSTSGGKFICACGRLHKDNAAAKHPMGRIVPHGLKQATTDGALIKYWWTSAPNANIGIATSGCHPVLDVDVRHNGDKTLAELERKNGPLPPTWRVVTGSGGTHVYFTADIEVRNSAGEIGPGLDVRGDGGYVVAPPSMHISGRRYTWDKSPDQTTLASMPAWLLATVQQPALTREWVLGKLIENAEKALAGKYGSSTANRALELLGRELGMFVERTEITQTSEFSGLTLDEMRAELVARARRLGLDRELAGLLEGPQDADQDRDGDDQALN
jgi:hypothetical protein